MSDGTSLQRKATSMGKSKTPKQNIKTEGGAFIGGNVSMGDKSKFVGRDDNTKYGFNDNHVNSLFDDLFKVIERHSKLSNEEKADIRSEIEELRQELSKKDKANESFLMRRLRNIGRMAPDILEVTVATITNPISGFGVIAKKVAAKAKEAIA